MRRRLLHKHQMELQRSVGKLDEAVGTLKAQGKNNRERWEELCVQADNEQDPQKMADLVIEIDSLLAEEQDRLNHLPPIKP
jgi:hypothetical protein